MRPNAAILVPDGAADRSAICSAVVAAIGTAHYCTFVSTIEPSVQSQWPTKHPPVWAAE